MTRHPNRKARCPGCGRVLSAYVPTGHAPSEGPERYVFRMHPLVPGRHSGWDSDRGGACPWWTREVPDDAFVDGKPNLVPAS